MDSRGAGFLREFLDRFRRSAGVPAQVTDEVAAELSSLFTALDALDREGAAIRADAAVRAGELREATTAEVGQLLAAGRERAERERLGAVAAARRAAGVEADEIRSSGVAEANRIRARAHTRIQMLVAQVVRCVMEGPA